MKQAIVELISVNEINILNPRVRNQVIAEEIHRNIREIGLKRPITVALAKTNGNGLKYDLVCGQGRLEAFIAAGEKTIPAIVTDVDREDAHIMSLIENIARRHNSSMELLQSIKYLKSKGYDERAIATKTNLGREYLHGIIKLLEKGEERLVNAVEKGRVPLYMALKIASEDDATLQRSLADAQASGKLTGSKLIAVQKLIDRHKLYGKGLGSSAKQKFAGSVEELIEIYAHDVKSKKLLVAKVERVTNILTFCTTALKVLLKDIHFCNQLKAEGLDEIPKQLSDHFDNGGLV